ncbi:MAG: FAD-dependent oxidoreductase, partial [Bdellovibrionales bacterium]
SWGWDIDAMRIVSACEASDIAGVDLVHDALYLPRSGSVCPRRLCQVYADGVEVRLNTPLHSSLHGLSVQSNGDALKADAVILAAGPALRSFDAVKNLDLRAVRGQVTLVKAALPLKTNICYGGYISAAQGGRHAVGASFQRWLDHAAIIDQDDHDNLANLARAIPAFPKDLEVIGHRAAVRCTTRDHFPVVGPIGDNLYVSAAHGSHGILSALMAADILAAMIFGRRPLVSDAVISALSPHRFVD